jgi:hypothetical protein
MPIVTDVMEVLHKIKAKLYPNYLKKGDGAFIARAKAEAPLSVEDVCASAKNRGGFTGSYEDLVEHTHIFVNEMVYQLLDGFSVQIGSFFSLHTRLGGTYSKPADHIDAKKISVSFRLLTRLRDLLDRIEVENEGIAGDGAYIDEVADVHTGALNSVLTPNRMLHITGNKIKIAGDGETAGVWFVNQSTQERVKVTENLGINTSAEIMADIPGLSAGTYKLEIVTRFAPGGTLLKEPRTIRAEPELTVETA